MTSRSALASWEGWQAADWPAPAGIIAGHTLRVGGVSQGAYASHEGAGGLNLGAHCGDDPRSVQINRERLGERLPAPVLWLEQVHGSRVHHADRPTRPDEPPIAGTDASVTTRDAVVLAVMSADCLPVLITDTQGRVLGAAHAGWRGLASGVLENLVAEAQRLAPQATEWLAWLGPAIGQGAFEVGEEVLAAFEAHDPRARQCFLPGRAPGKWQADLFGLARQRLASAGVGSVHGGGQCTVSDPQRYYSYRRDKVTGRLATLIWRDPRA